MKNTEKGIGKEAIRESRKLKLKIFMKNKLAVVGLVITILIVFLGVFADVICPEGPYVMDIAKRYIEPCGEYIFGTDKMGRDVFARIVYGIRISLLVGAVTTLVTFIFGMVLGMIAGYFKKVDNIIMRICEALMSIPPVLMAIALMSALEPSITSVIMSLCIVYTPQIARVARGATIAAKENTYIEAATAQGASSLRILLHHIAPNILSPVIVQGTYIFATAIILEASLSFLGAGIPAPAPSLGNILYEAKEGIFTANWLTIYPGIAMVLTVLGINILGDGLRDVLDPKSN
ncbi:MAG: ABC transporter permease [Lachnospiraceae bacterium]|nr:ABC transporter permease [Lachnospiraceae bacterium]